MVICGLSAICSVLVSLRIHRDVTLSAVIAQELHKEKDSGPRLEPWGTPEIIERNIIISRGLGYMGSIQIRKICGVKGCI